MNAIETHSLTCSYRGLRGVSAVKDLDLQVTEGSVYALLGSNGAGKTTTIKTLLGLHRPASGTASILGHNSTRLDPQIFCDIGYVSENQKMYDWMTVGQFLAYLRPLYPSWDKKFEVKLVHKLALPIDRKIRQLSRGMRMKASFVGALAYRPKLLVLDEPFSGLDPLVREEFIDGVLSLSEEERWTILVSTHDLADVESLADTVGFMKHGRLIVDEPAESLQARFRKIDITFDHEACLPREIPPSWIAPKAKGRTLSFVETAYTNDATIRRHFERANIQSTPMGLKSIYLSLAKHF